MYFSAESVEEIAKGLIPVYHPELATARIRYVFRETASKSGGRVQFGTAARISGRAEFLVGADFVIEIAQDVWNEASSEARTAMVDHLLERCWGEEDEEDAGADMKWSLRKPDCQEFATILRRHGAWTQELQDVVSVAKTIDFDSMVEEVTEQQKVTE